MASKGQKSVYFNLESDEYGDAFLDDIDFYLVESLMEKKTSTLQEDASIPEKTTPPLTAVENMMLRRDSMSITNLSRDSVPQSSESSRFLPLSSSDISNFNYEDENKNT